MKAHILFFVVLAILCVSLVHGATGQHHLMDARFFYSELRKTDLTPIPDWLGNKNNRAIYTYRFDLSNSIGDVFIKGTSRLQFDTLPNNKSGLFIDTLSAEFPISNDFYFFVGRRHFVQGMSYGLNSADVFLDALVEDNSLNETRRRIETTGIDAIGAEFFFIDKLTMLGFVAPEWEGFLNKGKDFRAGISATLLIPEANADLNFLLFDDKRPGGALSFSKTLGDSMVFYFDTSIRRNRSRALPKKELIPGAFILIDSENGEWYFAGTIGMGFTFVTGITFNLEYSHEGDGYNSSEWRDISNLIDINVKEWRSGTNQELGRGNLMTLNKVLRSQTLRKNYLFSRIFFPSLVGEHTSFEGTVLHSLDDFSGVFSLRTETEIGRLPTLGLYASTFYGGSDSEFGLRSNEFTFGGYVTFNF